ncbi:Alternative oxidase 1a, mitochondrial [Hordeum vulgare]|nr:Alternative oxidase 1a, mitochondrial [Hordeum vulgare]
MDALAGTPSTPAYSRDSSAAAVVAAAAAAAAAANPSARSFGFAAVAAPPSTGVARGLFMPPRMTLVAGGLASASVVNPRAPLLQLSNVAWAKKGNVSGKKKKAADGFGSSKPSRKRLAGPVMMAATAPEAPASSLVQSSADVRKFNIAQNFFKGEEKKTKKGNIKKGKPFTLPHCYEELKDDEKWKKRDGVDDVDESNKRKKRIELDHDEEEASSDDGKRSPTPNSVSYSKPKRSDGCKKDAKEKKKRKGDDELKKCYESYCEGKKRSERGEEDGKDTRYHCRGEEVVGRGEEGGGRGEEGEVGGEEGNHGGAI